MRKLFQTAMLLILFLPGVYAFGSSYSETEYLKNPSSTVNLIFTQKFSNLGFIALNKSYDGLIPHIHMDQIFQKNGQTVFFKQGLKPSDEKLIGKLEPIAKGLVFHGVYSNVNYAIFFDGFTEKNSEKILKDAELLASNFTLNFSLFPTACAADFGCDNYSPATKAVLQASGLGTMMRVNQMNLKCMISARDGVDKGFKDIDDLVKLAKHNRAKLWADTKQKFTDIVDFAKNYEREIRKIIEAFPGIDSEIMVNAICSNAASIFLGAGAVKGSLGFSRLMVIFNKLKHPLTALTKMKRAGIKGSSVFAERMVACAM